MCHQQVKVVYVLVQLMFSNDEDPISVKTARAIERVYMKKWIQESYAARSTAQGPRAVRGQEQS